MVFSGAIDELGTELARLARIRGPFRAIWRSMGALCPLKSEQVVSWP